MTSINYDGVLIDGRYYVLDSLGTGLYATAWLGYDFKAGKFRALKIFCDDHTDELAAMCRIAPHIKEASPVSVLLDAVRLVEGDKERVVFVYPVHGQDLCDYLEQSRSYLDESEIRALAAATIEALSLCKKAKLVHTDLKPSNFLLARPSPSTLRIACILRACGAKKTNNLEDIRSVHAHWTIYQETNAACINENSKNEDESDSESDIDDPHGLFESDRYIEAFDTNSSEADTNFKPDNDTPRSGSVAIQTSDDPFESESQSVLGSDSGDDSKSELDTDEESEFPEDALVIVKTQDRYVLADVDLKRDFAYTTANAFKGALRQVVGVRLRSKIQDSGTLRDFLSALPPLIQEDRSRVYASPSDYVLIDFGTAVLNEDRLEEYDELQCRNYRAPEIRLHRPPTIESDIWALGCMVYELFTGNVLFDPEEEDDWSETHMHISEMFGVLGPIPFRLRRRMVKAGYVKLPPTNKKELAALLEPLPLWGRRLVRGAVRWDRTKRYVDIKCGNRRYVAGRKI